MAAAALGFEKFRTGFNRSCIMGFFEFDHPFSFVESINNHNYGGSDDNQRSNQDLYLSTAHSLLPSPVAMNVNLFFVCLACAILCDPDNPKSDLLEIHLPIIDQHNCLYITQLAFFCGVVNHFRVQRK